MFCKFLKNVSKGATSWSLEVHATGQKRGNFLTDAGASVYVQAKPRVTLAVKGASRVHTLVLTSSVIIEALINICREKNVTHTHSCSSGQFSWPTKVDAIFIQENIKAIQVKKEAEIMVKSDELLHLPSQVLPSSVRLKPGWQPQ